MTTGGSIYGDSLHVKGGCVAGRGGLSRLPLSITDMRTEKQGEGVMIWGAKY